MLRLPALLVTALLAASAATPKYSTAGFFPIEGSPRQVLNFNPGWRFHKGDLSAAETERLDDSAWGVVTLPHGLELNPENASGMRNYQGPAWYRKHFRVPASLHGKIVLLYFEAVMGKADVWVNGQKVARHFGGYLPFAADVTKLLHEAGRDNLVAVRADNSDDATYPPGKPQDQLDFTYLGGIYRDVYLIGSAPLHVTYDLLSDTVAGGGVFAGIKDVNGNSADIEVRTEVVNQDSAAGSFTLRTILEDAEGRELLRKEETAGLQPGKTHQFVQQMAANNVHLWSPDDPYLHFIRTEIVENGKLADSLRTRIGIRLFEMRGDQGFFVNKKFIGHKLSGVNRHQDYVYVGNALPNAVHWRDAKLLREGGSNVIRTAHYPQDPAFMDACDELGILITVATPGWQFFNSTDPNFEKRITEDTRAMVRRDRNRPAVFLWETALNETRNQPLAMLKELHRTVHEEFPFPGAFTVTDAALARQAGFDFYYGGAATDDKNSFTREYGDQVDNWTSQNSLVRIPREWGEQPLLNQLMIRAAGLVNIYSGPPKRLGGTLWAGIDHQRGYHPDPFRGGLLDLYRIPRYAYYLFQSQYDPTFQLPGIRTGPMVHIVNELTQLSGKDVVVLSNCEEVRLTWLGKTAGTQKPDTGYPSVPHPPVTFHDVFNFRGIGLGSGVNTSQAEMVAEGLIGGQVVAREVRKYAEQTAGIRLELDDAGIGLTADGSDFVPVRAVIVDKKGVMKVLSSEWVSFEVTGAGEVIGDDSTHSNPMKSQFGIATALIRAGSEPGEIRVSAVSKGLTPAEIVIQSKAPAMAMVPGVGVGSQPRRSSPAPAATVTSARPAKADPAEIQKLKEEIRRLQLDSTAKEQEIQELKTKLSNLGGR
jgi:beta-galactosidase